MKSHHPLAALGAILLAAGCSGERADTPAEPRPTQEAPAELSLALEPVTAGTVELAPVLAGGGTGETQPLELTPVTAGDGVQLEPVRGR